MHQRIGACTFSCTCLSNEAGKWQGQLGFNSSGDGDVRERKRSSNGSRALGPCPLPYLLGNSLGLVGYLPAGETLALLPIFQFFYPYELNMHHLSSYHTPTATDACLLPRCDRQRNRIGDPYSTVARADSSGQNKPFPLFSMVLECATLAKGGKDKCSDY